MNKTNGFNFKTNPNPNNPNSKVKLKFNNSNNFFIKHLSFNKAFSLVEIAVSLLVISVIMAALTPVISKRLSSASVRNKISTNCDSLFSDGYCAMCYLSNGKCITCTRNCSSNEYKNVDKCSCESCSIKYSDNNCAACNSKSCTLCNNGYYLSNGKCSICPRGYRCYQKEDNILNSKTSIKEACPLGTYQDEEGKDYCKNCLKSTSDITGSVATTTAMTSCVNCTNGYYASKVAQGSACDVCPKGYYCKEGKYTPCTKGYYNNTQGATTCLACIQSSSTTTGSVATNIGSSECASCANGYYAANTASSECSICPKGYYCPSGKYIPCSKGYANNTQGATTCVSCIKSSSTTTGSVATSTGMSLCTSCTNGNYSNTSSQTSSCITCPIGYYCPSGKIISCPKGSYCPNTGSSSASACPAGKYTNTTNSTACTNCSAGYYASGTGNTGCSACGAGKYSSTGASTCTNCPVGKYSSGTGNTTCTNCSAGTYSNTGASACTNCSAGYYASGTGNTTCKACASGTYSNAGASSCTACSSKYEHCTKCNNNTCNECEENYKLSDDKLKCEKKGCPDKTIKISTSSGDLCVTQYNMGDIPELPLSGVAIADANNKNEECYPTGYIGKYCCYQGVTGSNNGASIIGNYSGAYRTVCDLDGATKICANLSLGDLTWRLPTIDELSVFTSYSINKGAQGLMLCDGVVLSDITGSPKCTPVSGAYCKSSWGTQCRPSAVWSSSYYNVTDRKVYMLYNNSWKQYTHHPTNANSVRCVAAAPD